MNLMPRPSAANFVERPGTVKLSHSSSGFRDQVFRRVPALYHAAKALHRRRFFLVGLGTCCAVLGAFVIVANHRSNLKNTDFGTTPAQNFSPVITSTEVVPAQGSMAQSLPQTPASPSALPKSGITPYRTPTPQPTILRHAPDSQWGWILSKLFRGDGDPVVLDKRFGRVAVWTQGRSGYYYCADSPYFKKLSPGSIMNQSSALQSGYQPKLGSYCP
jgi:hypothetical protein